MGARGPWARVSACAALAAVTLLGGCLPKGALSRRDEALADRYSLALDVAVRTEGLDLPPFVWHVEGAVDWSFTRAFRDGSLGHLARFDGLSATTTREGGPAVATPTPLDGAFVELRSFADGQLLAVTGASPWAGNPGHAEVLDVLWPALSPHLPSARADASAPLVTSWPTWVGGGPKVRTRLEARYAPAGETWAYTATLAGTGGYVTIAGQATGTVELGEGDARLGAHTFDWTRTVTTVWAGGRQIVQTQHLTGSLRHVGTVPAPLLDMPVGAPDAASDARALHLRDGRHAEDPPVDLTATLPFLLLPDDLPADVRARLGAEVAGTGSM
jgi:hypothetical protein